jgi:RNA polymerase sigma-70 factor (ECF subfamily)
MTLLRDELTMHWEPMVRVARSVLGCPDEAEECAAAAILQVLERSPQNVQNLEAFMVTVARRRAVDRLRSLERARRRDAQLAAQTDLYVHDVAEHVSARAEANWVQQQARARLSPRSMRILSAVAEGETISRVALREEVTVRAAESDLLRSRRLLRAVLARTTAALGAVWLAVRRLPAATVPASAALATFAVLLLPALAQPEASELVSPAVLPQQSTAQLGLPGPSRKAHTRAAVSPPWAASASEPPSRPSKASVATLVVIGDPAGGGRLTRERHGAGPKRGPVGDIVECVSVATADPIRLDPHQLGC